MVTFIMGIPPSRNPKRNGAGENPLRKVYAVKLAGTIGFSEPLAGKVFSRRGDTIGQEQAGRRNSSYTRG
jgi:hypothetical protein